MGRQITGTGSLGRVLLSAMLAAAALPAQQPAPRPGVDRSTTLPGTDMIRQGYILGPGDQVQVRVPEAEEIALGPYTVDSDGMISLGLVGKVTTAGLTVEGLESELTRQLRKYLKNPLVSITVLQYRSEPVFMVGAFRTPGIYPLQGRRTVLQMITQNGGLAPNASHRIRITRRAEFGRIPLERAVEDKGAGISSVEIGLGGFRDSVDPSDDILLQPFDVITAERAEMVYVSGQVGRVGGVELGERSSLSVTQVIAMSGGLNPDAAPSKARVLRPVLDTARRAEIPVDLKKILAGEANDFPLLPNDMLYVPRSSGKVVGKAALYTIPVVSAVYLLFR